MSGLVKSTRSNNLSTPSASHQEPGYQQQSSEYSGNTVKNWNDFPLLQGLGQGEQANSLVQEPRTIKRQGSFYQKRIVWSAFKNNIVYAVIHRPLKRRDDGKLVPQGEWFSETQNIYTTTKPPTIRKGILKNSYAQETPNNASSPSTPTDPFREDSEYALGLLPTEVQKHAKYLKNQDPAHIISGGSSGISDNNGRLTEENVRILIVSGTTALVIHGQRKNALSPSDTAESSISKMNQQDWYVKQYTYDISPSKTALSGKKRKGIES